MNKKPTKKNIKNLPKVIAVINQKGGVGKTTTTVNLAHNLSLLGKKILVIDLDPQGNASSGLNVPTSSLKTSLYDCLVDLAPAKNSIIKTQWNNLDLLPSSPKLATVDTELPATQRDRVLRLKKTLDQLLNSKSNQYDLVLIDAPPSLGLLTVNALVAANSVVLPVQAEYYALEGLGQLLETMQIVRTGLNKTLGISGILITMFDGRTTLSKEVSEQLKTHFKSNLFTTVIPRNVSLAEAPSHGKPIAEYAPSSSGAKAYKALAAELLKKLK